MQRAPAARDLGGAELGGGARRARAEVGERDAEFREALILFVAEQDGRQRRRVDEPPERVAVAGEVMADGAGAPPGIDADQQQARAALDDDVL